MTEMQKNTEYDRGTLVLLLLGSIFTLLLGALTVFLIVSGVTGVFVLGTLIATVGMLALTTIVIPLYARYPAAFSYDEGGLVLRMSPFFWPKEERVPWTRVIDVRRAPTGVDEYEVALLPPGGVPARAQIVYGRPARGSPSEMRLRLSRDALGRMSSFLPKELGAEQLLSVGTVWGGSCA